MAGAMNCIVAIPTRELFSGKVTYANIPSADGSYGVLPGHEMIVATNKTGGVLTLNLDEAGNEQRQFLLFEGASQVYNDIITVLGRFGTDVNDIDVDEVRKKAEGMRDHIKQLENEAASDQEASELAISRVRLEWYEMQIDYKEKQGK